MIPFFDPKTDPNVMYAVRNLINIEIKKRNIAVIVRFAYV